MSDPITFGVSCCVKEETYCIYLLFLVMLYLVPKAELLMYPAHTGKLMMELRIPNYEGCYKVRFYYPKTTSKRISQTVEL